MTKCKSHFTKSADIVPVGLGSSISAARLVEYMGGTCFEARNVFRAGRLYHNMIKGGDTIWLGIAGAGIAGGMGGLVVELLEHNFIDVICSTGAQVYHDLHFAFGLPVSSIHPAQDDNHLRRCGDTRIYDIGIREEETLEAQDALIREFVRDTHPLLSQGPLASWEFNYHLGIWAGQKAKYPERSFLIKAAQSKVPVFWDSLANHSITMNLARTDLEGLPVVLSPQKDIIDSAAIAFVSGQTGFVELGGGGPKNFIQQTGPTISQILNIDFEGADRGLQIGTAVEREGSLSSCTFGEAVTWGKYQSSDEDKLVQVWGEYSIIFPLLCAYVLDTCSSRPAQGIVDILPSWAEKLKAARSK
ncbi:MAG: hypothetical protein FP815_03640 [Desulfobulbaceae bacterium]|nr:hypothetical protein [Desulfobulbaceae bacterium]